MQSLEIKVNNVKCNGCVDNIKNGLAELGGIDEVDVDLGSGAVTISGTILDRQSITRKLSELGYPEAA
jgi:copper chaperone